MRAHVVKILIAVLSVSAAVGCEATPATRLIDPFGLIFSGKTPVRIGVNRVHIPLPPFFPKAPWWSLQTGLAEAIEQPVHFESLNPFQIQHHLRSGRLSFALEARRASQSRPTNQGVVSLREGNGTFFRWYRQKLSELVMD